ncbi:hypothetical protein ANCCAN_04639 [Ancylostoma caninum]|uniref:Uncharacterized protein n=1 Tax=Ancylostoma caninum TaxID=29170 RepID=A0A368GY10_ANCCA|nr:hypothetical protein ANCCAN_04639 [Ancylostoma caninum]
MEFYGNDPDKKWAQIYAMKLTEKPAKRVSKNINLQEQEVNGRMSHTYEEISSHIADFTKGQHIRKNLSKRSEEHKIAESSLNR